MVNVEFNEQVMTQAGVQTPRDTTPFLNKLVMKTGLVKTKEASNVVLIILAVICFLAAGLITFSVAGGGGNSNEPLPYIDDEVS